MFENLRAGDIVYKMYRDDSGEIQFDLITVIEWIDRIKAYRVECNGLRCFLSDQESLFTSLEYTKINCVVLTKSEYDAIKYALRGVKCAQK